MFLIIPTDVILFHSYGIYYPVTFGPCSRLLIRVVFDKNLIYHTRLTQTLKQYKVQCIVSCLDFYHRGICDRTHSLSVCSMELQSPGFSYPQLRCKLIFHRVCYSLLSWNFHCSRIAVKGTPRIRVCNASSV